MNRKLFTIYFVFISQVIIAQNPISPPGIYLADPSAHQWKDGKMSVTWRDTWKLTDFKHRK